MQGCRRRESLRLYQWHCQLGKHLLARYIIPREEKSQIILCADVVATEIGDLCRENVQCGWENSECSGTVGAKTCSCKNEYVASASKQQCLRSRFLDFTWREKMQFCFIGATVIGNPCEEVAQCASNIPNTICEEGVCKCNNFYQPSEENTECLKIPGKKFEINSALHWRRLKHT